jgi:SAM-dependent methyltransferase
VTASTSLDSLLATLAASEVEFVVVGMLAAVAQGAPITTHDVDIVPLRTPENIAKLVDVLVNRLDARYRDHHERVIPSVEVLSGPGHSLLQTALGPLDVLGAIEGGRDYAALRPRSHRIELSGHPLYVLDLAVLIELKRESAREKDRLALPILEETLRRQTVKVTDWRSHPLCGPIETFPATFWGPEPFNPEAWRELTPLFSPEAEIAAILAALGDSTDAVDVGGGTGLITQAIARRMPVLVIEPSAAQRDHLPPGITAREGRIEALPLADRSHDAAVATWVLQYTDDPMRAVAELARVARRRVVIVQGAPNNQLIELWNLEAAIAGIRHAHHGYLLAGAAELLERAGYAVTLEPVHIAVPAPSARSLADSFARMHFWQHPRLADMIAATEPVIAKLLATQGMVNDDAVVLAARRPAAS